MAKARQTQPPNFEEAITELERILSDMERGEVPLEESLVRYERGNFLIGFCRQVLGKAEQQIEQLQKADAPGTEKESAEGETDEG